MTNIAKNNWKWKRSSFPWSQSTKITVLYKFSISFLMQYRQNNTAVIFPQ